LAFLRVENIVILWNKPTESGLGDRLIDLFLLAAFAKAGSLKIAVCWPDQPNLTLLQRKVWSGYRHEDYKLENLLLYFKFPKNILFYSQSTFSKELRNKSNVLFSDYVGGIYTTLSFYNKFYPKFKKLFNFSLTDFEYAFKDVLKEFKPKNSFSRKFTSSFNADIAVHLRRGDKLQSKPDYFAIGFDEIDGLDKVTELCINKISQLNSTKKTIYLSSDDENVKLRYKMKFSNSKEIQIITLPMNTTSFEATYIDLWMLASSKYIILSQRHSNFALLASYLKKAQLVYFYKDNKLISDNTMLNKLYFANKNGWAAKLTLRQKFSFFLMLILK
jgi:hypothetical protein